MSHDHAKGFSEERVGRKLAVSTAITVVFIGIELGAGIYANSLALIGDALHNVTDALALLLALFALRVGRKAPTSTKTYGYQRAGILAAFVNAALLVALTLYIFIEAWRRVRSPQPVDSFLMIVTSIVALSMNGGITLWLRPDGKHDLGIRSAMLHMLGDALSSAGIIVGAILIRITGMTYFDPLISVLIGLLILWSSWGILKETVNLLLEGTPSGIDPEAVTRDLAAEPGIYGIHHLHIWALTPSRPALSCHILLGDVSLKSTGETLNRVSAMLAERYRIEHTTIQFEHAGCPVDDPYCLESEPMALAEPDRNR
ncbi:MAG TPA: cation diffusion facilitator family transporter [Thermoanaerobaculia bacterium]|nr:cation diffusion facilitator family transporter [Thermoanaerobaculia bacterium]